jgi:hypothetical protein
MPSVESGASRKSGEISGTHRHTVSNRVIRCSPLYILPRDCASTLTLRTRSFSALCVQAMCCQAMS